MTQTGHELGVWDADSLLLLDLGRSLCRNGSGCTVTIDVVLANVKYFGYTCFNAVKKISSDRAENS